MHLNELNTQRWPATLWLAALLAPWIAQAALASQVQGGAPASVHHRENFRTVWHNPVVFIPGDGGSQLEAKLNKTKRVSYICDLVSDWYDLWLNIHLLGPYAFDCLIDNMILTYNSTTRKTQNNEGVQIRATNFGSLASVANLDIWSRVPKTDYFERIISTLEANNNLTREVDMVGAAYDFRKAPNELEEWFQNLTDLIQTQYIKSGYRPVTLICHSMGCLNSLYLLNGKTQSWKDVFIKRLITLAAPWDGSFKAISAMLNGDNLGIPLLNKSKLQALQSSFPSLMYLFPREPTFTEDRVLVETREVNYTLKNLDDLFKSTGLLDQMEMWHDTRAIANKLGAPGVELWCLYGAGVGTPNRINAILGEKYEELMGDGDGTVNLESLRACERFAEHQEQPVFTRQFDSIDHIDILRSKVPAGFISYYIFGPDQLEMDNGRL